MTCKRWWKHQFKWHFDRVGNLVLSCKRCGKVWVS